MRRRAMLMLIAIAALVVSSGVAIAATTTSVTVPGDADPWLAGMPDGSTASDPRDGGPEDVAPDQSPAEVSGLNLAAGGILKFDVSGSVNFFAEPSGDSPDGNSSNVEFTHGTDFSLGESENGISDIKAPVNSLVGVFLGPDQPDTSPAPDALDFGTAESRDYTTLSPSLKQVFFIGDGRTSTGEVQQIDIPEGATRLFLGPMDGVQWIGNYGSFDVQVNHTPPAPACEIGEIEPPVNDVSSATDTDNMSAYKLGSRGSIPAKFQVTCDGNLVDEQTEADAHPMLLKLDRVDGTTAVESDLEPTTTGSANTGKYFRFVDADNHYIYNIGLWDENGNKRPKGTYRITISEATDATNGVVKLGGATHSEWFEIK